MKSLLKFSLLLFLVIVSSCDKKSIEVSSNTVLNSDQPFENLAQDQDMKDLIDLNAYAVQDTLLEVVSNLDETQFLNLKRFVSVKAENAEFARFKQEVGLEAAYQIKISQIRRLTLKLKERYKYSFLALSSEDGMMISNKLYAIV